MRQEGQPWYDDIERELIASRETVEVFILFEASLNSLMGRHSRSKFRFLRFIALRLQNPNITQRAAAEIIAQEEAIDGYHVKATTVQSDITLGKHALSRFLKK